MNEPFIEPTEEEKKAAVQQALRNQIGAFRGIAKDMDESETRVALAILMLNTAQQFNVLSMQIAQLTKMVAGLKEPTLFRPDGAPIIQ